MSVPDVCRELGISMATFYKWRAKLCGMDTAMMARMKELAKRLILLMDYRRKWGFGPCFLYLRNVKHFEWNHKRFYRIYREFELNLRIKTQKAAGTPKV